MNSGRTLLPDLRAAGLSPRKGLGQHYLTDKNILAGIVQAADLPEESVVIEVGPGPGTLTAELATVSGHLIAIELDDRLAPMLADLYADVPHVHIVHGDALALPPEQLLIQSGCLPPYFVVANLPYYITSPLLRHFLEAGTAPIRMVVTIQLDVAQRIVARPPRMSLLAVAVQAYALPSIVRRLAAGAFTPPPKVTSAVLRLDVLEEAQVAVDERDQFFRVVRAGFGQKRKTLRNSLASGLSISPARSEAALLSSALSPKQRAQELDIPQWLDLMRALQAEMRDEA